MMLSLLEQYQIDYVKLIEAGETMHPEAPEPIDETSEGWIESEAENRLEQMGRREIYDRFNDLLDVKELGEYLYEEKYDDILDIIKDEIKKEKGLI